MSDLGFFDPDLHENVWFDWDTAPEGWFDKDLIVASSAPPPPPTVLQPKITLMGVGH